MVGAGTMLDFEGDSSSYTVTVTATGPGHGTNDFDTIEVTINVTNVDEDPELTGMDSLNPDENIAITSADASLGTYMATDDEDVANVALTLSGPDASDFSLTDTTAAGGTSADGTYELAFKAVPDFEMAADTGRNNVYNITVTATDSDEQTDTMAVVVNVINVQEDGTVTLSTLQPRAGIGVMATLTDLDGATSGVTWKWQGQTSTNCSSVTFATDDTDDLEGGISGTYTPTADDIGKCLGATARYTDPQGSDTAMSELTASDQPVEEDDTNKAPTFPDQDMEADGAQTDQERTVEENTASGENIGTIVGATDSNGDNLTYALGGTDRASFSIDRATGQLMTKAMLNREGKDTLMVTVTATDPSGLSATVNVTIKVTNVDEDPEIMRAPDANIAPEFADSEDGARSVAEDTAAGEDIGDPVAAADANGDALTYALSGTDAASFDIDTASGQLMTLAALDYETKETYSVTVTASDSGGLNDSIDVTITVTNVDEAPVITGDAAPNYAENETGPVATYTATDPESATITWTLESDDAADFSISAGGVLTFKSSPDHEAAADDNTDNAYEVTVKASDGTNEDTLGVTVTVTDVNEDVAPVDRLKDKYDANDNGEIERPEVFAAIDDYLDGGAGAPTRADVFKLIELYLGD